VTGSFCFAYVVHRTRYGRGKAALPVAGQPDQLLLRRGTSSTVSSSCGGLQLLEQLFGNLDSEFQVVPYMDELMDGLTAEWWI
jgi:hypothetical protein